MSPAVIIHGEEAAVNDLMSKFMDHKNRIRAFKEGDVAPWGPEMCEIIEVDGDDIFAKLGPNKGWYSKEEINNLGLEWKAPEEGDMVGREVTAQRGLGGPKLGDGGVSECTCNKCGYKANHERGKPCLETKCPKCGGEMLGREVTAQSIPTVKPPQEIGAKPKNQQDFGKKRDKKGPEPFKKIIDEGINELAKDECKFDEMTKHVKSSMLKQAQVQPIADAGEALVNMEMAEQRSGNVEVDQIVEKYEIIIKLATQDGGRWKDFQRTGSTEKFLEDITKYTPEQWKEINSKLDTIIKDLDTVIVG